MVALTSARGRVDGPPMNVSAVNSAMNGIAAAQGLFAGAAQAAAGSYNEVSGAGSRSRCGRRS
jgi:hypothetical protein